MDTVRRDIQMLLSHIEEHEIYLEYKKHQEILDRNPRLKERVDLFRANNFRMQSEAGREHLLEVAERLNRESVSLRRIPEVNAYLDAELALCRLIQDIVQEIVMGVDMHVPQL